MPMLSRKQRESLEKTTLAAMQNLHLAEEFLAERGIGLEVASSSGLGVILDPPIGQEQLRGRLGIPYLTDAGPVNINGRCIQSHDHKAAKCKKYLNWKGLPEGSLIYGVQNFNRAGDWIAVTEGEFDAIILNMCGIPAVGIPGAEKWKPYWKLIFEDYSRVYSFADADSAGEDLHKTLMNEVGAIKVSLPDGYDVNQFYLEFGRDALRAKVSGKK